MMRAGPIPSGDVTRDAHDVFVTLDHERCHTRDDTLIQLGGHTASPWHDELSWLYHLLTTPHSCNELTLSHGVTTGRMLMPLINMSPKQDHSNHGIS